MAQHKPWTAEDDELLAELWGHSSVKSICKRLERTENAIAIKQYRLHLGSFLEAGEYVTFCQLIKAVTGTTSNYSYKTTSWIKNRGLPVKQRRVNRCTFKIVYLEDFWKWAEQNRDFINLSKMEENALGKEPSWVRDQRHNDSQKAYEVSMEPWTPAEDKLLLSYLREYRYTYLELSKLLHRTNGAIQRRVCDLGIKERPVKADNTILWTDSELEALTAGIKNGLSYYALSHIIGKSDKAIRGKVGMTYKTERLDAVRSMMLDPFWGSGAPVPTVLQAKRTAAVKVDLAKLAGLLLYHRNQLAFDGYWQKDMCQHWNDIKGCTAEQTDCDSCTCFQRIREQYCRRCGATVFSRTKLPDRLCQRCRQQRKKQYFKKMKALGRGVDEKGTIGSEL